MRGETSPWTSRGRAPAVHLRLHRAEAACTSPRCTCRSHRAVRRGVERGAGGVRAAGRGGAPTRRSCSAANCGARPARCSSSRPPTPTAGAADPGRTAADLVRRALDRLGDDCSRRERTLFPRCCRSAVGCRWLLGRAPGGSRATSSRPEQERRVGAPAATCGPAPPAPRSTRAEPPGVTCRCIWVEVQAPRRDGARCTAGARPPDVQGVSSPRIASIRS